ncbi:MAG: alpha/beta fold hydrolase [Woeseiaceae bacterium]
MNRFRFRSCRRYIALLASLFTLSTTLAAELAQRDVRVYGQNIHFAEIGSGPPLILLHGLWGGLNEWQPVIPVLSESHRVIVMDFIGFHGSDKPATQYHNALLSQYLAGFIDALGVSSVTLMGHAMGANAATYTAVHHPGKVDALVLVDGAGYRNPDRDPAQPLSAGQLRFRKIATGSTLASTRGLLERRVTDVSLVTDAWVKEAYALWVHSARAIGDMLFEGGDLTEEEMRQIEVPTLVVWGAEDKVFPVENAHRLAADIDGAEIHIIDNAGHLPQIEQPSAFLATVLPFLQTQRAN